MSFFTHVGAIEILVALEGQAQYGLRDLVEEECVKRRGGTSLRTAKSWVMMLSSSRGPWVPDATLDPSHFRRFPRQPNFMLVCFP